MHHFVAKRLIDEASANYDREQAYQTLLLILQSGLLSPRPSLRRHPIQIVMRSDSNLVDETLIRPACVCFCDIPPDDIGLHVSKYGHFGLSFPKRAVAHDGGRPVIYVPISDRDYLSPYGRSLLKSIERAFRALHSHAKINGSGKDPGTIEEAIERVYSVLQKDLIAFIKPFELDLPDEDPKQYYLEREWRVLGDFAFTLPTVRRIFLPEDFAARLRRDVPHYQGQVMST